MDARRSPTVLTAMLGLLLMLLFVGLLGCGDDQSTAAEATEPSLLDSDTTATSEAGSTSGERTFTLEELAKSDGKNGAPAYIAVDGVVYDVSDSRVWPDGEHSPCNLDSMAGLDLSEVIKQAPARMRSNLEKMPVVGTLAE